MTFEESIVKSSDVFHRLGEYYRDQVYKNEKDNILTHSQCFYLTSISAIDHPTLSAIALNLNVAKSSASIAIDKLIKLGALRKSRSSEDQRVYILELTPYGKRAVFLDNEVHRLSIEFIKTSLNTEEQVEMTQLFEKIFNACEDEIKRL